MRLMWSSFVFVAVVLAVGGDEPQEACVVDGTATVRILRDVACVAEASGSSLGPLFRKRLVESAGPCFRDVVDDALDAGDAVGDIVFKTHSGGETLSSGEYGPKLQFDLHQRVGRHSHVNVFEA